MLFTHGRFPDRRLHQRAVMAVATLGSRPLDSIPHAAKDWGQAKAIYRWIGNKRVRFKMLVQSVSASTAHAAAGRGRIFAIQDTTAVSFPKSTAAKLGPIGKPNSHGMFVHTTLAVDENGIVLGILDLQWWCRKPEDRGCAATRKQRPIEAKESFRWLRGMRAARRAFCENLPADPRPYLIHVMDREGDIHKVFEEALAWGLTLTHNCHGRAGGAVS